MINQKERLNALLFLEFNREKAGEIFYSKNLTDSKDELYVPINPDFLVRKITSNKVPTDLPISEFIVGMAYAIALDPDFTFAPEYLTMLKGYGASELILKKKISELYEEGKMVESFILLNGLYAVTGDEETENILLSTGEELALKDPDWMTEVLNLTDIAIENGNINGYLIQGSLKSAQGLESDALSALKSYIAEGGERSEAVVTRIEELDRNTKAEDAYGNVYEDPKESLKTLLELYPREQDNPKLIYSIAVCYRLLGNHEKAIFYLEEAQSLDPGFFDVLNELGLNYALIDDYATARDYFQAVFEATKEFGPMTNLIISLFNVGEGDKAEELYRQAMEVRPDDEILAEIKRAYLE